MKHITQTGSPPRFLALLLGAMLLGLVSQSALAAGTTAGTSISNTATLSYSVGAVAQTDIPSTSAAFVVDEKVNLTVVGGVTTNVVPGATAQATGFTVTNNANSPLDFSLAVNSVIPAGDNFDPTACNVFVESNPIPDGYQVGTDTATFIDELAADGTATVYAVCNIPGSAVDTNTGFVGLTATARGDFTGVNGVYVPGAAALGAVINATLVAETTGTVDIVFADIAGTEGDAVRDAAHSARDTYLVASAALTVNKTSTLLCDPFNGITLPKNIPGAMTQWSIAISNTGSAAATLTSILDTLPATLAHDPGQAAGLTVPSNAATCVAGAGNQGFMVTASAARNIGGTPAVLTGYFTTNTADGLDIAGQAITATFATILPADGGHATAGLLNSGESVTIIFNTTVQ